MTEGTVCLLFPNGDSIKCKRGKHIVQLLRDLEKQYPGARVKDHEGFEVTPSSPNLSAGDYSVILPKDSYGTLESSMTALSYLTHGAMM